MIHEIKSLDDVALFAKQLVNNDSLNFHPDDDFRDYVHKNGESFYTKEEADTKNRLMEQCFAVCEREGEDIYSLMGDVFLIETGLVKYIPLSTSAVQDEVAGLPGRHLNGAKNLTYKEIKNQFDALK